MDERQVLQRVELPLATPYIMAGIRTSAVAVVATATLLAYVGGGGLGRFIIDGAAIAYQDPRIFAGALFVAVLSIMTELSLALVQRLVVPRALRHVRVDRVPAPPPALGAGGL
jgi:osmoprotectant transport system permease protein